MKAVVFSTVAALLMTTGIAAAESPFGTTDTATDFTLVETTTKSFEASSTFSGRTLKTEPSVHTPRALAGYDLEAPYNIPK